MYGLSEWSWSTSFYVSKWVRNLPNCSTTLLHWIWHWIWLPPSTGMSSPEQIVLQDSSSNSNFYHPPTLSTGILLLHKYIMRNYTCDRSISLPRIHRKQPLYLTQDKEEQLWNCLPLYRAAQRGDYNGFTREAQFLWPCLDYDEAISRSLCMKITRNGDTALHVLVGSGKWFRSLKQDHIHLSLLTARNRDGHTPLCIAAMVGNTEAAEKFLQWNPVLGALDDTVGPPYPIIEATRYGHKEMVLLLIGEMARKMEGSIPTKESTASLFLHLLVVAGFYDVLLALVQCHPGLARAEFYGDDDESLLSLIAGKPSAFRSGTQLSFWQQLLYSVVPTILDRKLAYIEKFLTVGQSSTTIFVTSKEELPAEPKNWLTRECFVKHIPKCIIAILAVLTTLIESCKDRIHGLVNSCLDLVVAPINCIKDIKTMNEETLGIVKRLCEELVQQYYSEDVEPVLRKAILLAASAGISEIIEEIVQCYPSAIWFADSEKHNIFHLAVINRHENVFNFIHELSSYKYLVTADREDTSGNNILHLVGKLAPLSLTRLNLISGAALQMQRELQWFQEVEKFVQPIFRIKRNSYGKTPKMVFTEEHMELVKKGEKWMKETSNSCTFVASLIATVGFAAAITVPGGNNQDNGFPLFSSQAAFTIFAVAIAFCLFSSVASVLMFLSILTSRYAEEDFLERLPKRLILGLGTLFISMSSLMIAFGATIYLVFGQKKVWILIPVGLAGLMPVILFESLQFPLLLHMFMSTYGTSIFLKKSLC